MSKQSQAVAQQLERSAKSRGRPHAAGDGLPQPHGGVLCNLMAGPSDVARLQAESRDWPSLDLTPRQLCDLELLLNGGFSPLRGFMGQGDYEAVLSTLRLADGTVWPMPIALNVAPAVAEKLRPGGQVALRDGEGTMLAALRVQDVWQPDWRREAQAVFGTTDPTHPGVRVLEAGAQDVYVGGSLQGLALPSHYDYASLRLTPAQLREEFTAQGWSHVVAFQTRNPMHRAHKELTERATREMGGHLLLHPVVGMTKPGDVDHYTRVQCYRSLASHYPPGLMRLSLLNLAMRMGGPREALWHAIVRKNHGCSHFIVGRDHAGPGSDSQGRPFYAPYAAQELVGQHEQEIGVKMLPYQEFVYLPGSRRYVPVNEVPPEEKPQSISGTELRRLLREGKDLPDWFTYPNVAAVLRKAYPAKAQQGLTLFFTGLSGAGKSTIAHAVQSMLLELADRPVTLLDGDLVRKTLSSGLGFSKADRDANIQRIGFVAREITKNRGIAICAPIAPYADTRHQVREWVSEYGGFIEIHVATPLEVCEQRDRKGLYAKARAGIIQHFTGIDDPYEAPEHPELRLETLGESPAESAARVLAYLRQQGFLPVS